MSAETISTDSGWTDVDGGLNRIGGRPGQPGQDADRFGG
jgi:hypothetical protein